MAQTAAMMIYLFFTLFSISLLPWTSTGFSLKLIHRDSPLSPLYQSNLSDFQRFMKNVEISKARASYFQQQNELIEKENSDARQSPSIRLPLIFHEPIFTVEIGIGTPAVKRTLIFDTGSGLTWTQCKPCIKCYKQKEPLFDSKKSSSYKTLTKKHPLAKSFTCTPFGCVYRIGYYSGQTTAGVAATESFTFHSNVGASAKVSNLAFGCGTTNFGEFPPEISGIIGFDKEPYSFTRQLGSVIKGRFSYCMSPISSNTKPSYVRFGDEAAIRGRNAQRTPFLKYKRSAILYGLNLIDLSINGQKLGLGHNAFPDGCFIDSGASVSLLNKRAFTAVRDFIAIYFSQFSNIRRYVGNKIPKSFLCYIQPEGFNSFPSLTFHFQGADYHVHPYNLFFFVQGNVFCLAMMESKEVSILGAFQQRNVRIVYDLKENMLSFAPEDCSKDAA